MNSFTAEDVVIRPTPNPNAFKFICPKIVKSEGKTSYNSPEQAKENPMAVKLFELRGIDQLHFFQNVVTISKFSFTNWDELESECCQIIAEGLATHDPDFQEHDPEKVRRDGLSPELQKIEAILDKKIRPGLQGDGGDLRTVSFHDKLLLVQYEGACGSCPSATTGTLEAIRAILRDDYDPEIEVYIDPSSETESSFY